MLLFDILMEKGAMKRRAREGEREMRYIEARLQTITAVECNPLAIESESAFDFARPRAAPVKKLQVKQRQRERRRRECPVQGSATRRRECESEQKLRGGQEGDGETETSIVSAAKKL